MLNDVYHTTLAQVSAPALHVILMVIHDVRLIDRLFSLCSSLSSFPCVSPSPCSSLPTSTCTLYLFFHVDSAKAINHCASAKRGVLHPGRIHSFFMTNGLTMHGAKTSSNVKEKWRSMRKHCGKTGKPFLHSWKCPGCDPQSFPALGRKTSSGAPCRSRRQLPPTRQFPPRASQRLTMCQRCLSTPCSWTQACRPRERERQESVALHTLSQEDVVGHVAPTRQSPPRAAQQLTTCQLCLIRQRRDTLFGVSQCNQPSPRRPRQLAFRSRLVAGRRRCYPCLAESSCLRIEVARNGRKARARWWRPPRWRPRRCPQVMSPSSLTTSRRLFFFLTS